MLDLAEAELAEIIREFGTDDAQWADSLDIEFLLQSAQQCGFLADLEIHQLIGAGSRDDWFLLTLQIASGITLCSDIIRWRDVKPPESLSGSASIKHVLARLDEIALRLGTAFKAEALLRTGPELERVRELAERASAIDNAWDSESAQYLNEDGDVRDECLRRYDELRFDYALEAWEVTSALAAQGQVGPFAEEQ